MIQGHGDDAYQYEDVRINFSSNIYSHADMAALKQHLGRHLHVIDSYPEPEPYSLERLIAGQHGIPADCVLVTNGATEAIYLIAQTASRLALQGGEVERVCGRPSPRLGDERPTFALDGPSFSEYADASILYGLAPHSSPLSSPLLLWLCNPNNPTGRVYTQAEIDRFLGQYPLVVIDQSYEHHTLEPIMSPAEGILHDNLIQIHSLTKTYAIPGLRIGYVTAQPQLIGLLRRFLRPWSVNALAIEAAQWLLTHDVMAVADLPAYLREAQRLRDCLNAIPSITVLPTKTNFMLARIEPHPRTLAPSLPRRGPVSRCSKATPPPPTAAALKDYLARRHGILIRDASNFNGLDAHYFRVAAQLPEENDLLVQAILDYTRSNQPLVMR